MFCELWKQLTGAFSDRFYHNMIHMVCDSVLLWRTDMLPHQYGDHKKKSLTGLSKSLDIFLFTSSNSFRGKLKFKVITVFPSMLLLKYHTISG